MAYSEQMDGYGPGPNGEPHPATVQNEALLAEKSRLREGSEEGGSFDPTSRTFVIPSGQIAVESALGGSHDNDRPADQ